MRYHGNYVGPGWSAGKYQNSVANSDVPAIDEFDETAKEHDAAYALHKDLKSADYKFFYKNIGKGIKRSAAAIAVGAQGLLRPNSFIPEKDSGSDMAVGKRRRPRKSMGGSRTVPPTPRTPARPNARGRSATRAPSSNRSMSVGTPTPNRTVSVGTQTRRRRSTGPNVVNTNYTGRAGNANKRVKPLSQIVKYGVQVTGEQGHIVSTDRCQFIGHATCPVDLCKRAFFRALVKLVLIRANKLNPKWDQVPWDTHPTDVIIIEYRESNDPTQFTIQSPAVAFGTLTQEGIANALFAVNYSDFTVFERVLYRPKNDTVGGVSINLLGAKVHMAAFSQLKMQNQTVHVAADNEADDVNNVPLIGKSYQGTGSGTNFITSQSGTIPFIADNITGTINKASTANETHEPPPARMFSQVRAAGGIRLGPGEIKTSTISYAKVMSLQNFAMLVFTGDPTSASPNRYRYRKFGEFKMYALEKQLEFTAPAAETNIKIAYEHDLKFACMISPKRTLQTTSLVTFRTGAL